jgi:hypothetical protein
MLEDPCSVNPEWIGFDSRALGPVNHTFTILRRLRQPSHQRTDNQKTWP